MSKKKFLKYLNEMERAFKTEGLDAREELEAMGLLIEQLPDEVATVSAPLKFPENVRGYAVYSDGACRGNPGPGAWASLGMSEDHQILFQEAAYEPITTNNRMELIGAINALKLLMNHKTSALNEEVHLYSDSKYVTEGITSWVPMWKSRGWKKADNKAPENLDLWMELAELTERYKKIKFHWVKGHAGHTHNEYVDQMCNDVLDEMTKS